MTPAERTAFLRSDEDDPDYLRDCPDGSCPWCHSDVSHDDGDPLESHHESPWPQSCKWDEEETVTTNRARYQEERMAAAKIEEKSP